MTPNSLPVTDRQIRLGVVWESWHWLRKDLGTWVFASLAIAMIEGAGIGAFLLVNRAVSVEATAKTGWLDALAPLPYRFPVGVAVQALYWAIAAGMYTAALDQQRGVRISPVTLLTGLSFVRQLLIPSAIAHLLYSALGFAAWAVYGSNYWWLALIVEVLVCTPFLFTFPIAIDRKAGIIEAAQASLRLLLSRYFSALAMHLCAGALSISGFIVLVLVAGCVSMPATNLWPYAFGLSLAGGLLTWPMFTIAIVSVYRDLLEPGAPAEQLPT